MPRLEEAAHKLSMVLRDLHASSLLTVSGIVGYFSCDCSSATPSVLLSVVIDEEVKYEKSGYG